MLATTSSCATEPAPPAVTVTDSAGVEIVHSAAPAWTDGDRWRASAEPTLVIGSAFGDEAYSLSGVGGVIRLPGDRIVLADYGTSQLRFYGLDGTHVRDVGGEGDGPGEFRFARDMWRARGDSIVTSDSRLSRITVFDHEGNLGRTIPINAGAQMFGRRPFDDGSLLIGLVVPTREQPRVGPFGLGTRRFERWSPDGSPLGAIHEIPHPSGWGFEPPGPSRFAFTTVPFSISSPPNDSDGSRAYLGSGVEPEVGVWTPDGRLTRLIRFDAGRAPVDEETIVEFERRRVGADPTPESRARAAAVLDGIPYPDMLPTYDTILIDGAGFLWVRQYRPFPDSEKRWWVFDPSGRWLGEPALPANVDLREVGGDYLLGVRRDGNDVEYAVLYDLER